MPKSTAQAQETDAQEDSSAEAGASAEKGTKRLVRALSPTHSPTTISFIEHAEQRIEVTYTTKSGETVTTYKALAPEPAIALSETTDRPVTGIAVVGYGVSGKRHLANIVENKGCRLRFLVEDDPDLCMHAAGELQRAQCYGYEIVSFSDYERAFTSDLIDLVIVSSAGDRKSHFVEKALRAGKTVLCDRPVATEEAEVKRLFAVSRQVGKLLLTSLPGRPGFSFKSVTLAMLSSASNVTIRRLLPAEVAAAAAGGVAVAAAARPTRPPIAAAGEAALREMFLDAAMTDAFAVNFCMCMRPTEAQARVLPDDAGTVELLLQYPNQTQVRVLCSLEQLDSEPQQFTLCGPRLSEMQRIDHMRRVDVYAPGDGPEDDKDSLRFTQHYDESHKDALEQVYAAASGHKRFASRVRPHLMEQNCLDCLRLADAAYRALRTGETVPIIYTA